MLWRTVQLENSSFTIQRAQILRLKLCPCGCKNDWGECALNPINYSPWVLGERDFDSEYISEPTGETYTDMPDGIVVVD